jgi:acylphosphatase
MKKSAHVFISGNVQGVGYRYFVKRWAKTYGVKGWVRNMDDGRVEGLFQGEVEGVEKLIEKCKEGPFLAKVEDVVARWEEGEEFLEFLVR